MKARDFVYWLQGFFELHAGPVPALTAEQTDVIRRHLALVFVHDIDPQAGGPDAQKKLNEIHDALNKAPIHGPGGGPVYRC